MKADLADLRLRAVCWFRSHLFEMSRARAASETPNSKTMLRLSRDPSAQVRFSLTFNRRVPDDLLDEMARHEQDFMTLINLANCQIELDRSSEELPERLVDRLHILAERRSPGVDVQIAGRKTLRVETIRLLYQSTKSFPQDITGQVWRKLVEERIANRSNTPPDVIKGLSESALSEKVRAIASHRLRQDQA
jgi:hypothetical protein